MSEHTAVLKAKKAFDIIITIILCFILLPVMPFVCLAIKINSKGPVIYKQLRVGKASPEFVEFFYIYKLRTMYIDAETKSGAVWASENDPRITSIGLFLRKTRLDEFPQLINVLKGDMSLIGPRPERPDFYQKLENEIPFFVDRTYSILPGITGLAQVSQGYDTSIEDVRSKVSFDHSYALATSTFKGWIKTDIEIIIRTLFIMIGQKGR